MYFTKSKSALIAVICLALSQTNGVYAVPKSADSGVEYVKACDSGPDDVTNQCINRIPEDVGIDSGNHACAYHEAEVKCLGLCGNTVTWKTSYNNALKRYRLVCARFIEERLADKEEEEEANGGNDPPPSSSRKKPDSDDSSNEDSQADDASDSSKSKKQKASSKSSDDSKNNKKNSAQSKKDTSESSASSNQKAKSTSSKPSPSATDSAHAKSASPSSKAQNSSSLKESTDDISELINNISSALGPSQAKEKPSQAKNGSGKGHASKTEDDKEKRLKALLPTMDPEVAGSSHTAHSLTVCNCLLILSASLAYIFL